MISLNKTYTYEKIALFSLAFLMAIGGIYSYKIISFLLPVLTVIVIWLEGGVKHISLQLSPPLVFLLLLLIWSGMSVFWAEHPAVALKTFVGSTVTFIFALLFLSCLIKASPHLISKAYALIKISGLLLMILIIAQVYFDTFLSTLMPYKSGISYMGKMKPTGSILGLLSFVGCGFLWIYENRILAIFTFLVLVSVILLTLCQTAIYGLIAGTIVFGLSYLMPFWVTRIGMISSYTFLLLSPLLYTYVLSSTAAAKAIYLKWLMTASFFHRYLAWEYYSKKFFEKPLLGWGIESSRFLLGKAEYSPGYDNTLHPHNNSIQAYVELGLIGGILYALFFASLFYMVEKNVKDRFSIAVCNATIVFGFVGAEFTHNVWRNYWLSLVVLTAGLIILFLKAREEQLHG